MRKISILSLIAVLSATPMMAKAEIAKVGLQGNPAGTIAANTNVASTSYVQGAYNDLAGHINSNIDAINTLNGDSSVVNSVDYKISSAISEVNTAAAALAETVGSNTTAINKLNGDASEDGSVANSIANAITAERSVQAALTSKTIDADSNTISNIEVDNFKASAIANSINSNVESASSTALATEKAVAAAISAVNGDVAGKQDQLTAGGSNIATTVVQAANVGEVSASGVNSASDSSLVTQKAALSAALAAETAANAYTDNKRLTVYTTWNSAASSAIALSSAN